MSMALQGFDEALLSELLVIRVVGFGDAVGVQGESVPWTELAFSDGAIPILENSQYGGGSAEALHGVVAAEHKSGKMAAIRVAQAAGGVVVFREEERGERAVGRIFAEEPIHRAHQALRLIERDGALAAQIGLQVGHQESGGDSFSRDVADHEAEALLAKIQEVVIITTDFASLNAQARIFKRFERRQCLREKPGLDLFGNFEFLCSAAFGLQPPCKGPALRLDGLGHFVEAHQRKGVAVEILETGKDAAPNRSVLRARRRWVR